MYLPSTPLNLPIKLEDLFTPDEFTNLVTPAFHQIAKTSVPTRYVNTRGTEIRNINDLLELVSPYIIAAHSILGMAWPDQFEKYRCTKTTPNLEGCRDDWLCQTYTWEKIEGEEDVSTKLIVFCAVKWVFTVEDNSRSRRIGYVRGSFFRLTWAINISYIFNCRIFLHLHLANPFPPSTAFTSFGQRYETTRFSCFSFFFHF